MKLRIATIQIKGLTPYSQSRAFQSEKKKDEDHETFDERCWPEHMHVNEAGEVFIPAVAILQGMSVAASYLGKGGNLAKKGAATWAQNFTCGLAMAQGPSIGIKGADASKVTCDAASGGIKCEKVYCHVLGRRGTGARVWRRFPVYENWSTTLVIHILDETIPKEIFEKVLDAFALFIGMGRYRPENGGYLGRFLIEKLVIKDA